MGFGISQGYAAVRMTIRRRGTHYDLERPTEAIESTMGESTETQTQTVTGVLLQLYQPTEFVEKTRWGDEVDGDLRAIALPDADVQRDDRLNVGGKTYEAQDLVYEPDSGDTQLLLIGFNEVTNPRE